MVKVETVRATLGRYKMYLTFKITNVLQMIREHFWQMNRAIGTIIKGWTGMRCLCGWRAHRSQRVFHVRILQRASCTWTRRCRQGMCWRPCRSETWWVHKRQRLSHARQFSLLEGCHQPVSGFTRKVTTMNAWPFHTHENLEGVQPLKWKLPRGNPTKTTAIFKFDTSSINQTSNLPFPITKTPPPSPPHGKHGDLFLLWGGILY